MQIVLIAVISLDGRLTRPNESGPGFASAEDQAWFRAALQRFDCTIMGRATYDTIRNEVTPVADSRRLRMILTRRPEAYAAETIAGRLEFTDAPPAEIVAAMRRRGCGRCALLGGGEVYRLFLDAGLVDALWLSLEPVVLGGGVPLADGAVRDARFALDEMRLLSANTLLLNYRRPDGDSIHLPPP